MAKRPWLAIDAAYLYDERIRDAVEDLGPAAVIVHIALLTAVKREMLEDDQAEPGYVSIQLRALARQTFLTRPHAERVACGLRDAGLFELRASPDGVLNVFFAGWEEWQPYDPTGAKKKQRQRKTATNQGQYSDDPINTDLNKPQYIEPKWGDPPVTDRRRRAKLPRNVPGQSQNVPPTVQDSTEQNRTEDLSAAAQPQAREDARESERAQIRDRGDVALILDAWSTSTGRTRPILTGDSKGMQARRRVLRDALRSYPTADLVDAVQGWQHSAYHAGQNDTGQVWNDLELLLRNPKQIERFRDLNRQPPPLRAAAPVSRTTQRIHEAAARIEGPLAYDDTRRHGAFGGHRSPTQPQLPEAS